MTDETKDQGGITINEFLELMEEPKILRLTNTKPNKSPFDKYVDVHTFYKNGKMIYAALKSEGLTHFINSDIDYDYCFIETVGSRRKAEDKVFRLNNRGIK